MAWRLRLILGRTLCFKRFVLLPFRAQIALCSYGFAWRLALRPSLLNPIHLISMSSPVLGSETKALGLTEVTDPNDDIVNILERFDTGALGVCGAADQLMSKLAALSHIKEMTIHPDQVGIDPCNRGGEGVNAIEVGLLASDIASVGWSWAETSHAVCVEVAPGDVSVERFNMELVNGADGLAPVEEGTIKFGSLACGHTNYGLRAIGASAKSNCPRLSKEGRYSLELLNGRDPSFAKAVREGLRWKVIAWRVRLLYPRVLDVTQRARNANSTIMRKENEMSGLLQMHKLSASGPQPVNWNAIKQTVFVTNPPFADKVDQMAAFVINRSGGQDGLYLKQLSIFFRNFVSSSKRPGLPSAVYLALAEFPYHYVALSLLKTCWTCPLKYAEGKAACEWIGANEIVALGKSTEAKVAARLRAAESCLRHARALLPAAGIEEKPHIDNGLCTVLTKLDCTMGRLLLQRQVSNPFSCVGEVASMFLSDLKKAFPKKDLKLDIFKENMFGQGDSPDATPKPAASVATASSSSPDLSLYELNDRGDVVSPFAVLRKVGLDIGSRVIVKPKHVNAKAASAPDASSESASSPAALSPASSSPQEGVVYKIMGVEKTDVQLKDTDGRLVTCAVSDFVLRAEIFRGAEVLQKHAGWPFQTTMKSALGQEAATKARILLALQMLSEQIGGASAEQLDILEKPARKVVAKTTISINSLVLVPETLSVRTVRLHEKDALLAMKPFGPLEPECVPSGPLGMSFVFEPRFSREDVCPFWFVTPTENEKEANMVFTVFRVQLLGGADPITPMVGQASRRFSRKTSVEKTASGSEKQGATTEEEEEDMGKCIEKIVKIPVLVNKVSLKPGAELKVFHKASAPPSRKTKASPITVSQLQKRACV